MVHNFDNAVDRKMGNKERKGEEKEGGTNIFTLQSRNQKIL